MTGNTTTNQTQFDFETMAVVLCAMAESGVTLGTKHYEMMSALDGKRGKDGFQHQFRKVKARAKELQEQIASGGGKIVTPVKKAKANPNNEPGSATGKKSGGSGKRSMSPQSHNPLLTLMCGTDCLS
jgi:hypothetical protein